MKKFREIQDLFARLGRFEGVSFEPHKDGKQLHLEWRGRYLSTDYFGDGIAHVLMMAYEFAQKEGQVFLIEEPETHMHPGLQRILLEYMQRDDSNQYIVTTHSPVFLDSGRADAIYRVDYDGDVSTVKPCQSAVELHTVLDALDVRASDILQANAVIWVEGPTDRMFLKHCFELMEKWEFVEGIHYQIVYYGGGLRSHFTIGGDKTLVDVMRLGRHVAMLCDRDSVEDDEVLGGSKNRLCEECEAAAGFYWITDGREIENYLSDDVLTLGYAELLGDFAKPIKLGKLEKLSDVLAALFKDIKHGRKGMVNYGANKVDIMPRLLKHMKVSDLDQHDLRKKLGELEKFIEVANQPTTSAKVAPVK